MTKAPGATCGADLEDGWLPCTGASVRCVRTGERSAPGPNALESLRSMCHESLFRLPTISDSINRAAIARGVQLAPLESLVGNAKLRGGVAGNAGKPSTRQWTPARRGMNGVDSVMGRICTQAPHGAQHIGQRTRDERPVDCDGAGLLTNLTTPVR